MIPVDVISMIIVGPGDISHPIAREYNVDEQAATEEARATSPPSPEHVFIPNNWPFLVERLRQPRRPTFDETKWISAAVLHLPLELLAIGVRRMVYPWANVYDCTVKWMFQQVGPRSKDVLRIAFGILHLMTAAVYYLLVFDGTGTVSPSWTNVFG